MNSVYVNRGACILKKLRYNEDRKPYFEGGRKMKALLVIDMQKDFVDGALGTAEAVAIVPAVKARIEQAKANGERLFFTRDTHTENYMNTQEGRKLPVPHCIEGTEGWQIIPELQPFTEGAAIFDKPGFGSLALCQAMQEPAKEQPIEAVTLIGLCTDICVISNAMLVKAALPEVELYVDSACCAGVTPQSHQNALETMKMCQITVL